jgi:hypothetical protein
LCVCLAETVVFKGWAVGGEYVKNVVVKNLQIKLQKVVYVPPESTSPFSIACPPAFVTISPGTSLTIPVTFRPTKPADVSDKLQFTTLDGVPLFSILLRADVDKPELVLPQSVDFGLAPVGVKQTRTFTVTNASDRPTVWRLNCLAPFSATPIFGELEPKRSCEVEVSFLPDQAVIYESQLSIKCDSGETAVFSLTLLGYGKYAHLLLCPTADGKYSDRTVPGGTSGEAMLQFPDTLVSEASHMKFRLFNPTPVPAHYTVNHISPPSVVSPSFQLSTSVQVIAPKQSLEVKIAYEPKRYGEELSETFEFLVVRGPKLRVTCQGKSLGPKVFATPRVKLRLTLTKNISTLQLS